VQVESASGPRAVSEIHPVLASPGNLVLLRLAKPAVQLPLRLGYVKLLRLGDPVWAVSWPGPGPGSADTFSAPATAGAARFPGAVWTRPLGVVGKFKHFPDQRLQMIDISNAQSSPDMRQGRCSTGRL
jgi:hypothetical protein